MPTLPAQVASSIRITGPSSDGVATRTAVPTTALRVAVLGAVRLPGVYQVAPGATARDLIAAAGGAHTHADLSHVDLTTALQPGQALYVPLEGEVLPLLIDGKVALNAASAQQLRDALGITLTVARAVLTYRTQHGAFTAVSQLLLVPVTRATYDRIKDLVTV